VVRTKHRWMKGRGKKSVTKCSATYQREKRRKKDRGKGDEFQRVVSKTDPLGAKKRTEGVLVKVCCKKKKEKRAGEGIEKKRCRAEKGWKEQRRASALKMGEGEKISMRRPHTLYAQQ